MEDVKWLLKKCGVPILVALVAVIAGVICWGELHTEERKTVEEVWEPPVEIEDSKGYDLPVDKGERENVETDCKKMMGLIRDIYEHADKKMLKVRLL